MTWIPRVGVDLVSTAQIAEKHAANPEFWAVYLTAEEWEETRAAPRWLERAAGRWAAKEAVVKVLRPRRLGFPLTDVRVARAAGGRPAIELADGAARAALTERLTGWDLSISHSAGLAIAVAVARCESADTEPHD